MPAAGFVDPWCARAGSRVALHLSSADRHPSVSVVRLDLEPIAPTGWTPNVLAEAIEPGSFEQGSWLEVPDSDGEDESSFDALDVEFLLTGTKGTRTLVAGAGFRLDLNEHGRVVLRCGEAVSAAERTLEEHRWYVLRVSRETAVVLAVTIRQFDQGEPLIQLRAPSTGARSGHSIALGASADPQEPTLNLRVGRVVLSIGNRVVQWCFTARAERARQWPSLGEWRPILVHNNPTFSVPSARWNGTRWDPRTDVTHYDAIHLHDDDLGEFAWEATHDVEIPMTAPSGVYAFQVVTTGGTERIPFFVRAARPAAHLVFLVPTATYVAYADEYLPAETYPWKCSDRGHRFAQDNDLRSLYDVHSDRSGVTLSTWRRPKATLRDDYRYPLSNSPHLLPVDLQLLRFLHSRGIEIDLLTDHDLHAEGLEALVGYSGILTGSHPEYWSLRMILALDQYLARGGNLAYLGGNGFYLVVAIDADAIELRREPTDSIWSSPPSEQTMALDAEQGGYWASRGRPPQSLVGSTFLMMGFGPSRPYRRLAASYSREWAWVFDGLGDEPIGDSGEVLGGAAGYEVDGVIGDEHTPPSLVRLATADGFDPSFQVRDALAGTVDAANLAHLRRADMTLYRHTGGGLVFSVGSVAWCGALPGAGSQNAVGAITSNIARHLAECPGRTQ